MGAPAALYFITLKTEIIINGIGSIRAKQSMAPTISPRVDAISSIHHITDNNIRHHQ
jgi:hypothetical protein